MVKAPQKISSSPEFFKVYIPNLSSQMLRIPPAFVKNFDVVVPNKTILKDPSGRFWHLELKEVENDLFFQNGWQDFVKNHSLELGDFLIFRYKGNLGFDVRIFGKTGCKKEEALVNGNIDKTASYVKKEEPETRETLSKPTLGCKSKYSIRRPQNIGKLICLPGVDKYARSKRTINVRVEEGRVFEAADFGEPKNSHFTASINPSRPYMLHVPKELVTTNVRRTNPAVIFRDPSGKSWPVSVCFREDGRFDITKGWQNFWRRNGLGGQDKCIFEFINGKDGRDNVIQVHIYRGKGASKPHSRYMTRSHD